VRLIRTVRLLTGAALLSLMAVAIVAVVLVLHGAWPTASRAETGAQSVSVIDGDTVQVDETVIQLFGIDAPELGQMCRHDGNWFHCGLDAAFELNKLIGLEEAPLHCMSPKGKTGHGSQVCLVGHIDLAHVLLSSGYVIATPEAGADYREAESSARSAGLGLWHSEFVRPMDWRAGRRLSAESERAADACPIKAIVSRNGERHYYVPTDKIYDTVEPDLTNQDRRFCSDEAARLAGWIRKGQRLPPSN